MYNNGVRLQNIQTIDHDISIIQYVIPLTLRTIRTQIDREYSKKIHIKNINAFKFERSNRI